MDGGGRWTPQFLRRAWLRLWLKPRRMSEGLYVLPRVLFAIGPLISQTAQRRPVKSISVVESYHTRNSLRHFVHLSLIFTWGRKYEIWPWFSTPASFYALWCWDGAAIIDLSFELDILPTRPIIFTGKSKYCTIWHKFGLWGALVPKRSYLSQI